MRRLFLLFLLGLGMQTAHAQVYDSSNVKSIKFDLHNMMDYFPAILISYEHQLHQKIYLHHEAGPVLPRENERGHKFSGFKLREEVRYYVSNNGRNDLYFGVDARYTQERIKGDVTLGYECVDSGFDSDFNCKFQKSAYGIYKKELLAFGFRAGMRHSLDTFFLEYDLGIGYGKDFFSSAQLTNGYTILNKETFRVYEVGWKALPTIRAKVGMYLGRRTH